MPELKIIKKDTQYIFYPQLCATLLFQQGTLQRKTTLFSSSLPDLLIRFQKDENFLLKNVTIVTGNTYLSATVTQLEK